MRRYQIPLAIITLLGLAKYAAMLLSKAPIYEFFGTWGFFLLTGAQTLLSLWFVLIPAAIVLMFYGQSFNIEVLMPPFIVLVIVFKLVEVAYNNMANV